MIRLDVYEREKMSEFRTHNSLYKKKNLSLAAFRHFKLRFFSLSPSSDRFPFQSHSRAFTSLENHVLLDGRTVFVSFARFSLLSALLLFIFFFLKKISLISQI